MDNQILPVNKRFGGILAMLNKYIANQIKLTGKKIPVTIAENEEDWHFVFLQHNGKKVMAVF